MRVCILFIASLLISFGASMRETERWSVEESLVWQKFEKWPVGCNFIPSSAVNELEMFQEDTYDTVTIDRELGWAESLGFNTIRVFLHYLLWEDNAQKFLNRMENFLSIADSHHIKTMFVLFDDCWRPDPKLGKQPDPTPGVHNSQWLQCPGGSNVTNTSIFHILESYVKGVISHFAYDKRVLLWDLYNEPGNSGHMLESMDLLKKSFEWGRAAQPTQPLTAGVWNLNSGFDKLNAVQISLSDVITFHSYGVLEEFHRVYNIMKQQSLGRTVFCSEYMARTVGSKFETHLPFGKKENIGMIN